MSDTDPLPCPFCGSPATRFQRGGGPEAFCCSGVTCPGYGALTSLERWNRRAGEEMRQVADRAMALVIRLHEEATLSEGQCCKALGMDRVAFRKLCDERTRHGG